MLPGIRTGFVQPRGDAVDADHVSAGEKRGGELRDLRQFSILDPVGCDREVRFAGENLGDALRERIAGAELDKGAHAVIPRLTDRGGEIHSRDRLTRQHVGHAGLRWRVGGVDGVGVEAHTTDARDGPRVKLAPFVFERLHGVGMHYEMLMHQRAGARTEALAERAAGVGGAADHQVVIGVDDGDLDIRRRGDFCAHAVDRRANAPVRPIGRYIRAPGFTGRFEGAAKMALIHGGRFDIVEQAAHILPEAEGEESVAFAE